MKKKKISIILPNLGGGGAEKNYLMLANKWIQNDFKVEFVLLQKEGIFLKHLNKSIKIYNLNVKKYRYSFLPILKFLLSNKSDLIIVNLWPLTSITLLLNLLLFKRNKIVIHDHQILSKSYTSNDNKSKWYLSFSIKLTYFLSNGIIAVSNAVKNDLINLGCDNKKITVIYNPISLSQLNKKINVDHFWGQNSKYRILTIGSLKYEKDFISLLRAFALIRNKEDIKLAILGEGEEEYLIKKEITNLGLDDKVILPGFREDLNKWYSSANLFVMTSIHEGFGNVLADALSYGLQSISTESGGPDEILGYGEYGDLCPIKNPKLLSKKITDNLNNLEKRPKSMLIKRAKNFEISYISKLYINYINKIID